ncbi:MAG: hypothetical protein FWD71_13965 [Oscillospiraceae bacterium]|nr:hypothetical protein [Oscillospiraceae bacterium]
MQKTKLSKILSLVLVIAMIMTMSAFMGLAVSAASLDPTTVTASIDFVNETLNFTVAYTTDNVPDKDGFYVLYALKAVPNESLTKTYKYTSEKWYPVYITVDSTKNVGTGSIDISKYIPKFKANSTDKDNYYIAYRLASDPVGNVTVTVTPADTENNIDAVTTQVPGYITRGTIPIPARPSEKAYKGGEDGKTPINDNDLKSLVIYNNGNDYTTPTNPVLLANGSLKNTSDKLDVAVKVGLNAGWMTIPAKSALDILSSSFPTGDTAEVKWAANQDNKQFASASIKVKIPAAPAAPKLTSANIVSQNPTTKVSEKVTVYKGFTAKMQYSVDGTVWTDIPADKVVKLNDADKTNQVNGGKGSTGVNIVSTLVLTLTADKTIYFRTSGTVSKTDKSNNTTYDNSKPNSAVTSIPVVDPQSITATVIGTDPVVVNAVTGAKIENAYNMAIELTGDTFKSTVVKENANVAAWITNLPKGLTVTVTDVSTNDDATATIVSIAIAGTPAAAVESTPMTITIPGSALTAGSPITVDNSVGSAFAIAAPAPSAKLTSDVSVTGTVDTAITSTDLVITISNDKIKTAIAKGSADVAAWITGLPDGLSAAAKANVAANATSVTITITGTPTTASGDSITPITITIPGTALVGSNPITVTGNVEFTINEAK